MYDQAALNWKSSISASKVVVGSWGEVGWFRAVQFSSQ